MTAPEVQVREAIDVFTLLAVLLLAYGIGSIPTSIIVGRSVKGIDVRNFGSRNAGATNVYRVLGLKAALLVFIVFNLYYYCWYNGNPSGYSAITCFLAAM